MTHFAYTVLEAGDATYHAGEVFTRQGQTMAWGDCIILGFSGPSEFGTVGVKLARPYAYASCIGTTCPTVLTGHEIIKVPLRDFIQHFEKRDGHPMVSTGGAPHNSEGETLRVKLA